MGNPFEAIPGWSDASELVQQLVLELHHRAQLAELELANTRQELEQLRRELAVSQPPELAQDFGGGR